MSAYDEEVTSDSENGDEDQESSFTPNDANATPRSSVSPPPRSLHTVEMIGAREEQTQDKGLVEAMRKKREEDLKKGKAVARQIDLWDTLLAARISLHKSVTAANRLPASDVIKSFLDIPECRRSHSNLLSESALLSDELFDLQEKLLKTNNIITPPARKRRKLGDTALPAEYFDIFVEATRAASALEQLFHPYLLQTLSKWSSKIQAVTPSALLQSNRNSFAKGPQNFKSAVQLVEETLLERDKLLARTQLDRSNGQRRIGMAEEIQDDETNIHPEIFDDTDFYQKMLRNVIEARGNDGVVNEDWLGLQKQKKAKKKVDTKASKGRKIRYETQEKIQNFMVPMPIPGSWHDEQIDELFSSLLGKGFQGPVVDTDTVADAEPPLDMGDALKDGFRVVFG